MISVRCNNCATSKKLPDQMDTYHLPKGWWDGDDAGQHFCGLRCWNEHRQRERKRAARKALKP